jgi:hypothetical protein
VRLGPAPLSWCQPAVDVVGRVALRPAVVALVQYVAHESKHLPSTPPAGGWVHGPRSLRGPSAEAALSGVGEREVHPRLDETVLVDVARHTPEDAAHAAVGRHGLDHDERERLVVDAVHSGKLVSLAQPGMIAAAVPVGFVTAVVTFILPAGLGSRDITIAAVLATVLPAGVAVAAAAGFRFSPAFGRARSPT